MFIDSERGNTIVCRPISALIPRMFMLPECVIAKLIVLANHVPSLVVHIIFFTVRIASITFHIRAQRIAALPQLNAAFPAPVAPNEKNIPTSQSPHKTIHHILLNASPVFPR